MAVGIQIQHRRATAAAWATSPKVLAIGELGVTTDTHVIKIGDGVNVWSDLDVALEGAFLGLTAKAADSELLDGIDATGFLQTADATTAATANKVAKRTADGQIKIVAADESDEAVNLAQMNTADVVAKREILRSVSDATTTTALSSADINKMVVIANSSTSVQRPVTIPTNASDPIAVGSWIDVSNSAAGNLKLVAGGGITILGGLNIFGNYSVVRLLKVDTDVWMKQDFSNLRQTQLPRIRVYKSSGTTAFAANVDKCLDFDTISAFPKTFNPDSEWFDTTSFATTKKIIVVKDGQYTVQANWNGTTTNQNYIKICKVTGTAVVGTLLATGLTVEIGSVIWTGYLTAGEAVGAVFFTGGASDTGKADGAGSRPHDFTVVRTGD